MSITLNGNKSYGNKHKVMRKSAFEWKDEKPLNFNIHWTTNLFNESLSINTAEFHIGYDNYPMLFNILN